MAKIMSCLYCGQKNRVTTYNRDINQPICSSCHQPLLDRPECYLNEKKNFIKERNIEKITKKREYLKYILEYYENAKKRYIPYLSICSSYQECQNICEFIDYRHWEEYKKEIDSCENVYNYIVYPVFMSLLRIEINKNGVWKPLLKESFDGIAMNISSDDKYFKRFEEHIRYKYIILVIMLIEKMIENSYDYEEITAYLNNANIRVFSEKNKSSEEKFWSKEETIKQHRDNSEQLKKSEDIQALTIEQLTGAIIAFDVINKL